jgi:regulatory protein
MASVVEAAVRFLEPRPRSTAEVRRRLGSAGYREDLVEQTVERLTELGVLDDESFAHDWVRSRDRAHPRGERALRSELRAKGIAEETIDRVLDERRGDESAAALEAVPEEEAARRLLGRKDAFLRRAGDPRLLRQRAYTLLVRNGFAPDLAWRLAAGTVADGDDGDPSG